MTPTNPATGTPMRLFGAACIACLVSAPAAAQEETWAFEGSIYLFGAETTLSTGPLEGELSFSDALENLDFAAMAALAARKGRWAFIADLMHFDLGFQNDLSGPFFSRLDTDSVSTLLNGLALYRIQESATYTLELGGGFRHFRTETTLDLQPGSLPAQSISTDDNWTDPVIAAIARFQFDERWSGTVAADYGSFVSDRETYQLTATLGYRFADNWTGRLGYRHVTVDNEGNDFKFQQSGFLVGATYSF